MLWWPPSSFCTSTSCSTASGHWSCNATKTYPANMWKGVGLQKIKNVTHQSWLVPVWLWLLGLLHRLLHGLVVPAPLVWLATLTLVVGMVVPHGLGFHQLGLLHLPLLPLGRCSCSLGSLGSSCSICCCCLCQLGCFQLVFPVFLPVQEPFQPACSQGTQLLLFLLALILAGFHEPPSLGPFFL